MLIGWCFMESSATCPIYCQRREGPASVLIARMGSSIFPLCLTLLLCSVYGSPHSVSKTWFLQAPFSPEASHTLYWLYSILLQVGQLSSEAGKCCVSWFEFWSISLYLLWATTSKHFMFWLSCRCWSWWDIQRHSPNQLGWVHTWILTRPEKLWALCWIFSVVKETDGQVAHGNKRIKINWAQNYLSHSVTPEYFQKELCSLNCIFCPSPYDFYKVL